MFMIGVGLFYFCSQLFLKILKSFCISQVPSSVKTHPTFPNVRMREGGPAHGPRGSGGSAWKQVIHWIIWFGYRKNINGTCFIEKRSVMWKVEKSSKEGCVRCEEPGDRLTLLSGTGQSYRRNGNFFLACSGNRKKEARHFLTFCVRTSFYTLPSLFGVHFACRVLPVSLLGGWALGSDDCGRVSSLGAAHTALSLRTWCWLRQQSQNVSWGS